MISLEQIGWNSQLHDSSALLSQGKIYIPARISFSAGNIYTAITESGLVQIKAVRCALDNEDEYPLPVVGDWVVLDMSSQDAIIREILPRKNSIKRQAAGNTSLQQIIASNIDIFFLVTSCNRDFNLSRIERYLTLTWESNAVPVIILNKTDLDNDTDSKILKIYDIAPGIDVEAISALHDLSIKKLTHHLKGRLTGILLGSSGVGKSTIVNRLMQQDLIKTQDIRSSDSRGRHTTTSREMFLIPDGGIIIDTPGLREIQLLNNQEGLENTFRDIEEFAKNCHFSDCKHETEPFCNVRRAIEEGLLDERRLINYKKMMQEITYYNERKSTSNKKLKWKGRSKIQKQMKKHSKY